MFELDKQLVVEFSNNVLLNHNEKLVQMDYHLIVVQFLEFDWKIIRRYFHRIFVDQINIVQRNSW